MKKILYALIVMISINAVMAQECDYRKNAKDEFTGDELKMTKWQTLINHAGLMKNLAMHFSLVEINGQDFIELKYELKQSKSESIGLKRGDSRLFLKMANDEVVALDYAGDKSYTFADREYKRTKGGDVKYEYDLTCKFLLKPAQKEKLAASKVVKVRLVLEKSTVELDIEEKLKAPLLGFANRGLRPKKIAPQEYFMSFLPCI